MWQNASAPDQAEYRSAVVTERVPSAVRTAAAIIFVLNMAFVALDWYAFPGLFWTFLGARMALNASLLVAYLWTYRAYPQAAQVQLVISAGDLLLWVIHRAGAPTTEYYAGLMLLFLGFPLVLYLTVSEALISYSLLLAAFLASPWIEPAFTAWRTFTIHALFLSGGAFTGIASCAYLESVRFKEYGQRKEIEEARDRLEELDKAKSRFTANVHHELRTPLTLMLAPIEGFLSGEFGEVSDPQREYLKTMHINALRLLKLINNLLDLARIESDQLEIRRQPVSMASIATGLVSGAQPLAARKRLALTLGAAPHTPVINADPDALEKIIMNLLGNALKFTEPGGSIDVEVVASDGGAAVVVRDTGIGLEHNQLERIFDRFAQVDNSATRRHEGTGIGLSLSRELVVLHGGRIWAESGGLGQGTAVRFWLPVGQADEETQHFSGESVGGQREWYGSEVATEAVPGEELRYCEIERTIEREAETPRPEGASFGARENASSTILVCEDNAGMRRLLQDILSREFCVEVAQNGREGLEAVRRSPPDLVLTDLMMPEMSGIELCRALRENDETAGIPVVLITSRAEREMKIAGLETGAADYVTKPFHSRELLARVRSPIRLRRLREELAERNRVLETTNEDLAKAMHELKEAEAHLVRAERLTAVGELAAGIAHEVNNPVNFAKVAASTMSSYVVQVNDHLAFLKETLAASDRETLCRARAQLASPELEEALKGLSELAGIVEKGLERTSRLVGDLRDLAAPWQGPHSSLDVARAVESALQLTRYAFQRSGISARLDVAPGLPKVVGEPRALGQVFLNILKNAAEVLEPTGGSVWVALREEGRGIAIDFRDDGPGVEPAILDRLFDPFFSTKPGGKGTGLGLSISRQVVEDHGGRIGVTSEMGRGACFSIWLPIGDGNEQ